MIHLFGKSHDLIDREAVIAAVKTAEEAECQVIAASMLGHKADLCFMVLSRSWRTLRAFQSGIAAAGIDIVDSYVSITEVSEYAKGLPEHMVRQRVYPELPPDGLNAFCFYPMSKKRETAANWFATPYDDRNEMMMEHGSSGRKFAGRVTQVVTGSTGLDDHEWGVTLFALNPDVIKEVVYTMRFDKGSALYGEFGTFYVGYLDDIDNIV